MFYISIKRALNTINKPLTVWTIAVQIFLALGNTHTHTVAVKVYPSGWWFCELRELRIGVIVSQAGVVIKNEGRQERQDLRQDRTSPAGKYKPFKQMIWIH